MIRVRIMGLKYVYTSVQADVILQLFSFPIHRVVPDREAQPFPAAPIGEEILT